VTVLTDGKNRDSLEPNDEVQIALCTPTRAGSQSPSVLVVTVL